MIELLDRLAYHGVRHAVICPGSRSTPLALAAEHHPDIRTTVHVDERGAGYFALGIGKATGRPALVITTSGTAVANLLPACIEAHQANVPLLLLTADRPPRLRGTGANQTMEQPGLFDRYVRWSVDDPDDLEAAADEAMAAMMAWPPGPAHWNQPLDEPLAPDPAGQERLMRLEGQAPRGDVPDVRTRPPGPPPDIEPRLLGARGMIVCGPDTGDLGPQITRTARKLGAVVVKDALSGLRFGTPGLSGFDAYMDHPLALDLRPDWILQLGKSPTSKALRTYLEHQSAPRYKIDASGRRWNDIPGDVQMLACDPVRLLERWEHADPVAPNNADMDWLPAWMRLEQLAEQAFTDIVELDPDVEAAWVPSVIAKAPRLFVGNSMPIRDVDRFARRDAPLDVYANRGVSGIDGTIATAAGIAQTGPLWAVIGDVAFQHDLGSLPLLPDTLRLIVIDNGGGRIFHHLPISQATPHFERLFVTPPQLDIATACEGFGKTYQVTRPSGLADALAGDAQVLIVKTDGQRSAHERQQMQRRLHRAIAEPS